MGKKIDYAPEKIQKLMDKINFFHDFSKFEKKICASSASSIIKFEPGAEIIREGEKDTYFYIILKGSVKILKNTKQINTMKEGDFFGEMAFLANTVRSTSVIADTAVIAYQIDQPKMQMMQGSIREKIKDQCIVKLVEGADRLTEEIRTRM
ncbi:MAG: cyclic nucleotide-binding domain-containing protein [Magnetococcales bacterium]|nr:cyclic nucleotide-binding domain-containing protein [Magnetococcales bacterium]